MHSFHRRSRCFPYRLGGIESSMGVQAQSETRRDKRKRFEALQREAERDLLNRLLAELAQPEWYPER